MKRAFIAAILLHASTSWAQDWGLDLTEEKTVAKDGKLQIVLEDGVTGAKLFIDDEHVGELPGPPRNLKPGTRKIEIKKEGYTAYSKKLWIEAGKLRKIDVKLEPLAGPASVADEAAR